MADTNIAQSKAKRNRWDNYIRPDPLCKFCGEKGLDRFYPGRLTECKSCTSAKAAASKKKQKENNLELFKLKNNAQAKKEYSRNPEKFIQRSKDWRINNPEKAKEKDRKKYQDGGIERARQYREKNRERVNKLAREWRNNNLEKANERLRVWREINKEYLKEYNKKKYAENKNQAIEYSRNWRKNNPDYSMNYIKLYRKNNPGYAVYHSRLRELRKFMSIPRWADLEKIRDIYKKCSEKTKISGIKHHVDHIIPLKGKNVCGLHVEYNLQIITASENCKKSNKF